MVDQFRTETVTTLANLMDRVHDFAVSVMGWTDDVDPALTPGVMAVSKAAAGTNTNDVQVAFGWDTGAPNSVAVYQYNHASGAGNYNTGRAGPWDQDGDSGSGAASLTEASIIDRQRHVPIGNTPIQYWAFGGTSPAEYVYVVVEVSQGEYRHFGFGELDKFNDWDGGAFAYGWRHAAHITNNGAVQTGSTVLLDGHFRENINQGYAATINMENLPGQAAGGMWGLVCSVEQLYQFALGDDRQSNDGVSSDTIRGVMQGGFRQSIPAHIYGMMPASPLTGYVPGYPIMLVYLDSAPVVDDWYGPMGVMDGVLGVNVAQFAPAERIAIDGVNWRVFPSKRKGAGNEAGATGNQGIMYRENVV